MMNKLTKKAAIAIAVGTMTIAATGAVAHASEIRPLETVDISIDDSISKSVPCYGFGGSSKRSNDTSGDTSNTSNWFENIVEWIAATWDWIG